MKDIKEIFYDEKTGNIVDVSHFTQDHLKNQLANGELNYVNVSENIELENMLTEE